VTGTPYPTVSPFPPQVYRTCLPSHIVERLDVFGSVGKHEVGLTRHEAGPRGIEVMLVLLDLDGQCGDVIINLLVSHDLSCQPPVVGLGHHRLEDVKVATWTSEHVAEPQG
jgi:hypothetical protein